MTDHAEKLSSANPKRRIRRAAKSIARDGVTESAGEKQTDADKVRSVSRDEITKIAMARFSGLSEGGGMKSIAELAKEFKHAPALIAECIEWAFRDGLVEIEPVDKPVEPRRKERLEERLHNKFKKLNKAVVIESVAGGHSADPLQDPLHRNLGMAMAQFVASLFRNNDVIGVGSGRAVDVSLRYFPNVRAQNVTLMSLTGSVYSTPNAKRGMWLDADRHVIELAKHFPEPKQYLICHPLAYEPDELQRARERVWLGSPRVKPPTQCLLGVGTVAQEHRFYLEAEAHGDNQEPFLKPIHGMLARLVGLCKASGARQSAPDYSPAAEMSNFFFYVPPPPNVTVPQEEEIRDCIRNINSRLLNIQEDLIKNLQLLVVAGTRHKAHAIRALLNNDAYPVTHLCTDAEAATEILNIEEGRGIYAKT